jgi:hypothetical protein
VYLQQAREHEKPRQGHDLDLNALFPAIDVPQSFLYEQEHLLVGLNYALVKSARHDRGIRDADLIATLSALARRYQTLASSGLVYEAPMPSLAHQAIAGEVQKMIQEYREAEQKHLGYTRLRDADVLRALVFLLRMGSARASGRPKSRAFVDFLFRQFPESESSVAGAAEGCRLVVP